MQASQSNLWNVFYASAPLLNHMLTFYEMWCVNMCFVNISPNILKLTSMSWPHTLRWTRMSYLQMEDFAQDTWIPNACSPRRDEINVNSDVSNKTDRAGGKRNMQSLRRSQWAQNYIKNTTRRDQTTHQPPQSMLRGGICLAPSKHLSPFNQKSFDGSWFEI